MRLRKTENGGFSVRCRNRERNALLRVRMEADRSEVPGAERRLFPDPLAGAESVGENAERFRDEWREFVEDDRRSAFREDLDQFDRDVGRMVLDADGQWRVEVPPEHVEPWFSALNQARLVMHERHRLPDEGSGDERAASAFARLILEGRLEPYLRYRLYAGIQEWITVTLLARP